jgi:hypothetical protein
MEDTMSSLAKVLTGLAGLAFLLAIVANFAGPMLNTPAEGFSRACNNLALIAIALVIAFDDRRGATRSGTSL